MPKAMTDRDRLLAFAFRASLEELQEAKATIDAAIRAKSGKTASIGSGPRKGKKAPVKPAAPVGGDTPDAA